MFKLLQFFKKVSDFLIKKDFIFSGAANLSFHLKKKLWKFCKLGLLETGCDNFWLIPI